MPPAARINDMHVCPLSNPVPHVGGPILPPGKPTVMIGGLFAATVGTSCICTGALDSIAIGSTSVLINHQPAARLGDKTAHGGSIVAGEVSVLIGG